MSKKAKAAEARVAVVVETAKAESKPKAEPRPCVCGCGGETKGGLFVSGHDGRVHGWFRMVANGEFAVAGLRTPTLQAAFGRWDGNGGVKAAFAD